MNGQWGALFKITQQHPLYYASIALKPIHMQENALCHLSRVMEPSEGDPAYMVQFQVTLTIDMEKCKRKKHHMVKGL